MTASNMQTGHHKASTKRSIVELARQWPLYFARIFPVSVRTALVLNDKNKPNVKRIGLTSSTVRLSTQGRGILGDHARGSPPVAQRGQSISNHADLDVRVYIDMSFFFAPSTLGLKPNAVGRFVSARLFFQIRRRRGRFDGQGGWLRSADRNVGRNDSVPFEQVQADTFDDEFVLEGRGTARTTSASNGK